MQLRRLWSSAAFCVLLVCVTAAGCGGNAEEFAYVAIRGTVTCNGEPVKAGILTFRPTRQSPGTGGKPKRDGIVGRPAVAVIQEDGSYVLETSTSEGREQGAVIGSHRIVIEPARTSEFDEDEDEDEEELEDEWSRRRGQNPYLIELPCRPPRNLTVELADGDSVINIEMSGGGKVTKVSPEPG